MQLHRTSLLIPQQSLSTIHSKRNQETRLSGGAKNTAPPCILFACYCVWYATLDTTTLFPKCYSLTCTAEKQKQKHLYWLRYLRCVTAVGGDVGYHLYSRYWVRYSGASWALLYPLCAHTQASSLPVSCLWLLSQKHVVDHAGDNTICTLLAAILHLLQISFPHSSSVGCFRAL